MNETEITSVREFFAEAAGSDGELFMIRGSAGFIEIAIRNASAAEVLKAERGQLVILVE